MSDATRSLEVFSTAFVIDAKVYFREFWPTDPSSSAVTPLPISAG
jgi:hypothetical protein